MPKNMKKWALLDTVIKIQIIWAVPTELKIFIYYNLELPLRICSREIFVQELKRHYTRKFIIVQLM
jgi:hypothetical protein